VQTTVSIIVVNWNGKHLLPDCLASLRAQTFTDFEVIVVDNDSTDGSSYGKRDGINEVIFLPKNVGFAGGNNAGIVESRAKYVALLNNDARVGRNWLAELVATAEQHPDVGMFASKIIRTDGKIDSAGCTVYPDGIGVCRGRGGSGYDQQDYVAFPSGCAAMYRRDMLDQIGLFDERFFMYCEDTDLGLRAQKAGWKCLYVPTARVEHLYSQSTGAYSLKKLFYIERNRLFVVLKNFTIEQIVWSFPYTIIRYFKMLRRGLAWSE